MAPGRRRSQSRDCQRKGCVVAALPGKRISVQIQGRQARNDRGISFSVPWGEVYEGSHIQFPLRAASIPGMEMMPDEGRWVNGRRAGEQGSRRAGEQESRGAGEQ